MIEIFRRAAALFLICLGGYLMLWPGGQLLIVSPYEGSSIKGREITVTDPGWYELAAAMADPEATPELVSRSYGFKQKRYIFKPDEPPFSEIPHYPNKLSLSP